MRYGFYLPTRGRTATPEDLEALVRRGEALGFTSVMIADHIVFPSVVTSKYPYTVSGVFPGQGDALEQLALMAFIAGKTERLRLVTSVMILPYRNPVATAKTLATIDVLSRGRVTVGVGVGWLREEFEALGAADFDRRGAVSDEYLAHLQGPVDRIARLVRGGILPLRGRALPARARAKAASAHLDRRPQQGRPPPGRAARRRLAPGRRKPGGPAHARRPRRDLDELYRLTEAEGRDPSALTISYKAPLYDVSRPVAAGADRRPFSGSPDQIAEDIATYERLGVSELIFDFRSETSAESLERMERFAPVMRS
jgi:alkanesulfonate monooxygenase SsuD/methylene tetrahydromethanopterin reductase-like flavin-dependent oxidoreductase (luciferase family)